MRRCSFSAVRACCILALPREANTKALGFCLRACREQQAGGQGQAQHGRSGRASLVGCTSVWRGAVRACEAGCTKNPEGAEGGGGEQQHSTEAPWGSAANYSATGL